MTIHLKNQLMCCHFCGHLVFPKLGCHLVPWAPPFIPSSEASDLMMYVSDNYTSYSASSRLSFIVLSKKLFQ